MTIAIKPKLAYLDIETTAFFNDPEIAALPKALQLAALPFGVGVLIAEGSEKPKQLSFSVSNFAHMIDLAIWETKHTIVTFNGFDFDLPIIAMQDHSTWEQVKRFSQWNEYHFDLFKAIKDITKAQMNKERWYKLDDLAKQNLGKGKIADGQKASEWLRTDDPALRAKAVEYCVSDVNLLKELVEFAMSDGLILPERPERGEKGSYVLELNEALEARLEAIG